jgi:hypothetical protein
MRVIWDDLQLCECCMFAAVNGDTCQCDHDYHSTEVTAGLERLGPHLVPDFDSETQDGCNEFSRSPCDCCKSKLHGSRHRFAVLGE